MNKTKSPGISLASELKGHLLFVIVFMLAVVLRFWRPGDLPLLYDEYSALHRAELPGLSQLITEGVMKDTHPVLHELWLFAWIRIFGTAAWLVKLPFIIMSVLSFIFFYKVFSRWFGRFAASAGLLVVAVSQFHIVYSQTARPYPMGMLLLSLLLWQFDRWYVRSTKARMVWLAVLMTLCAFNHHFTALAAVLMWVAGFALLPRHRWLQHFAVAALALLFYSPHLGIFIAQWKQGGLSTILSKPDFAFLHHHLYYVLNYSLPFIALVFFLPVAFFIWTLRHQRRPVVVPPLFRYRAYTLGMWVGPLIIGFVYSVLREPLLYDRVLVFFMPFLFMWLFSFVQSVSPWIQGAAMGLIASVGLWTLVVDRQHFVTNYAAGYHESYLLTAQYQHAHGAASFISAIHHVDQRVRQQCGLQSLKCDTLSSTVPLWRVRQMLDTLKASHCTYAWTTWYYRPPFELADVLRERYPVTAAIGEFTECEFYAFRRDSTSASVEQRSFYRNEARADLHPLIKWMAGSGEQVVQPGEEVLLATVTQPSAHVGHNAAVVVSARLLMAAGHHDADLVWQMRRDHEIKVTDHMPVYECVAPTDTTGMVHNRLLLVSFPQNEEGLTYECMLFNHTASPITVNEVSLHFIKANRWLYKLNDPL